jgi:uncharacterized protein YjbI with pentapeptide repeats
VFNRQYGKPESGEGKHPTVQDLSLENYKRFLEEAALLTWQQPGLIKNIDSLQSKCKADAKLSAIFNTIKNEKGEGIGNLLIAFFFKHESGHYEFSHKSFQEYLVASKASRFLTQNVYSTVTIEDFATKWLNFFGPMRMTEHTTEFFSSFLNTNNNFGSSQLDKMQSSLAKLTEFAITNYFPIDKLAERLSYSEELAGVKNAGNSLLDILCNVSSILKKHPSIHFKDRSDFLRWHQSLADHPYGRNNRANRSWLDLSGCYLKGANLKRANLVGTRLNGARLERANLVGANLLGANLKRANLKRANLERANLLGANLERANLVGANLKRANLVGANLGGPDLRGADFRNSNITADQLQYRGFKPTFDKTTKLDADIWYHFFPDDEWPWGEAY